MASPDSPAPAPPDAPLQAPRDSSAGDSSPRESSVERRRAMAARRGEMLGELAEAGLSIAKALEREALRLSPPPEAAREPDAPNAADPATDTARPDTARPDPARPDPALTHTSPPRPSGPDSLAKIALAFGRVSRAVRQTLMLQERLAHGPPRSAREEGRRRLNELSDAGDPKLTEVSQTLLQVISAEPEDTQRVERLLREAWERLEDEEILEDLARRPAHDIAARICRDIGVTSDWCHFAFELRSGRPFETAGLAPEAPRPRHCLHAEPYEEFLIGAAAPSPPEATATSAVPAAPSPAAPRPPVPTTLTPSRAQGP